MRGEGGGILLVGVGEPVTISGGPLPSRTSTSTTKNNKSNKNNKNNKKSVVFSPRIVGGEGRVCGKWRSYSFHNCNKGTQLYFQDSK